MEGSRRVGPSTWSSPIRPDRGSASRASPRSSPRSPAVLVLVSCDPVSLARDVTLLSASGYRAESVEVLDLFPNTTHVETVTRFVAT